MVIRNWHIHRHITDNSQHAQKQGGCTRRELPER